MERAQGVCGELALRRSGGHLEIVCNGVFLISTENESSSRALVRAAVPLLPSRPLHVLLGGLGVGHALDEALALPGLRRLTVIELEPAVLGWFRRYGGAPAERAAADRRVRIHTGDVGPVLDRAEGTYDLVALDTDNGPDWLVREANASLYDGRGLRRLRRALRPGGVAAFWTTGHNAPFRVELERVTRVVTATEATDLVGGRTHTYVMYVARAGSAGDGWTAAPATTPCGEPATTPWGRVCSHGTRAQEHRSFSAGDRPASR